MNKLSVLLLTFSFLGCSSLKDPSFVEILNDATHDIQVDSVKYFTYGMPFIPPILAKEVRDTMSISKLRTIDSLDVIYNKTQLSQVRREKILEKFGLHKLNLGCVIGGQTSILSKKYRKVTDPYLEQRNGKNWKWKMEKELEAVP